MKAAERTFIRFTASSIIIPPKIAAFMGLYDRSFCWNTVLHDVNGTGVLYGANKTHYRGDYTVAKIDKTSRYSSFEFKPIVTNGNKTQ